MAESPEQFRRRVRVRLPIADRYLGSAKEAEAAASDLLESFRHPLLRVAIRQEKGCGRKIGGPGTRDRASGTEVPCS